MKAIFAPIEAEMAKVEENLRAIAQVEPSGLADILDHILSRTGKKLRPALTLLSGSFYNYDRDRLIPMATAIEVFHNATLVHDDTVDDSALRRGRVTVNRRWGKGIAVLAGDYLFARAAELVASIGNLRLIGLFAQTLITICSGELGQVFSAFDWGQTRHNYFQRIAKKTASLFTMATESGAVLSQGPEDTIQALRSYGHHLGMAFQIVDDILDFTGEETALGKPVGSDLLQGTLTLPTILYLERYPQDNPLAHFLGSRKRKADLGPVVGIILDSPVIEESYGVAAQFCFQARRSLDGLPDKPSRQSLMELADYIIQRRR